MLQFRYVGIHERCCDSSTDLGVKASFAYFVAIGHLQGSVKSSGFVLKTVPLKNYSRNDRLMSIEIFCVFPDRESDKRWISAR
jgi:hypothetical protein